MTANKTIEWTPQVEQRVRAKITLENDLTDDGMGIQLCASRGDELIVRQVRHGYRNCIAVSHEHITDNAFCVALDEIEPCAKAY